MLPIVLGIAIILASIFPASAMHVKHFANDRAQVIAMSGHVIPTDKKVQDHEVHAICGPGMGCFAFTFPAEETFALAPFRAAIKCFDAMQLVTRIVAPPLPPPKIIIFV